MPWGKKWPVQMNLPFFAVKAYVPGGVQNQAEKNSKNAFRPVPVQKFTFPEILSHFLSPPVTFESLFCHLGADPKSHFESLFSYFFFSGFRALRLARHITRLKQNSNWGTSWEIVKGGVGGNVPCDFLAGGGGTYCRAPPPKPLFEASESGICLVCARFLQNDMA